MAGKVISVSVRIDEEEQNLLSRALSMLIWSEQDNILRFAREHIYVPDGNGGVKKFEGDYKGLLAFFESQPGRLHGMDTLDRLTDEVRKLHTKLLPNYKLPLNIPPENKSNKK